MRSPRAIARDALVRVEAGSFAHLLVPSLLRGTSLSRRDRALVTDLVYGTVRAQRRVDELLSRFGRRPMAELDPPVRAVLRMGAYELSEGRPAHAAVGETVGAAPARGRGYVNAVLRALASAGPPWPVPPSDAVTLSYPDWIYERLIADLGAEDARAALSVSNKPPPVTLRPNPRCTTAAALADELRRHGADVQAGRVVADAVRLRGAGDLHELAAVVEGRATPQDEASQAVVAVLEPGPGDRVLDVAAAPGGKATAVGEIVGDRGHVTALDRNLGRLGQVRVAARRLGLTNLSAAHGDGRHLPVRPTTFDRVLVDAPCSGLGVLRRRPDARWRIEEDAIPGLAALQCALVVAGAQAVRPGGMLVYSACTMTAAETTEVATRVSRQLPGYTPVPPPQPPWRSWGLGGLLLPQDAGTDGMFVVRFRRGR